MMNKIGVVGVGKLGLCMALSFERSGYDVYCYDKNDTIMNAINTRSIESFEPGVMDALAAATNIHAVPFNTVIIECDIIFVVVATPTMSNNEYDHQYIDAVVNELPPCSSNKTLVISCTVMPEYCANLAKRVETLGYNVCYNPEFIAQGDIIHGFENPDMVLIGSSEDVVADRVKEVYERVCKNKPSYCVMGLTEAEITKISLNCYITMKIAYANMIGDLVKRVGCNPQTVLDAVSKDSRVGDKCMKYGFGYGGPCFPRDNKALQAFATHKDVKMLLSEATDLSNEYHLEQMLHTYKKEHSGTIVFECVSYKPESVLIDKSFALDLAVKLAQQGVNVHIHERACVIESVRQLYGELFTYKLI